MKFLVESSAWQTGPEKKNVTRNTDYVTTIRTIGDLNQQL